MFKDTVVSAENIAFTHFYLEMFSDKFNESALNLTGYSETTNATYNNTCS